jgi:hypothetical protein
MTEAYSRNALFAMPWPAVTGFAAMISACSDGLQACASAGAAWQGEIAGFANRRSAENCRTWTALLSSTDLGSALKIQQQWGLQAASDYNQEATRIARLVTSVSLTGTTPEVQDAASLLG